MDFSFAALISALRREFRVYSNHRLEETGLTQGLYPFILYVGKHPGCSQRELTRALLMDGGHTARSVSKLEADGFLSRAADPRDHRANCLSLTKRGEETFALCHELFNEWDARVLRGLSREERETLCALLLRVTEQSHGMEEAAANASRQDAAPCPIWAQGKEGLCTREL